MQLHQHHARYPSVCHILYRTPPVFIGCIRHLNDFHYPRPLAFVTVSRRAGVSPRQQGGTVTYQTTLAISGGEVAGTGEVE